MRAFPPVSALMATLVLTFPSVALAVSSQEYLNQSGDITSGIHGYAIAGGDFNGDGYSDLVVGDGGGTGVATIYFGGPTYSADNDLELMPTGAGTAAFGWSVANAGDFNGDGYLDVLVGDPFDATASASAGSVHAFWGGPTMDGTADWIRYGYSSGDKFGWSIDGAGDMNSDGYGDIIIGQPGRGTTGRASVYIGAAAPNTVANLHLNGQVTAVDFATAVTKAGDLNGDGYDDVAVNAPTEFIVNVYFGSRELDSDRDAILDAEDVAEAYGAALVGGGDINNDGYDDILVGAPQGAEGWGLVYIHYGSSEGPSSQSSQIVFAGSGNVHHFGASVAMAGDVNQDGYDDFLVGGPGFKVGSLASAGRVDLFLGGDSISVWPVRSYFGEDRLDQLGTAVAGPGDMDGDGFDDIAYGVPFDDTNGTEDGRVVVHSIFPYRLQLPGNGQTWVAGEDAEIRWLGRDLADLSISLDGGASWSTLAAGVGGDDLNAAIVATPGIPTEFAMVRLTYAGQKATLSNSITSTTPFRIVTPHQPPAAAHVLQLTPTGETGDFFGYSADTAGDVNGDGFDDFIVGALLDDAGGLDTGAAYLYYGGPELDDVADLVFAGEAQGDQFGSTVAAAGDVNGDGFGDLFVGALGNDVGGSGAGRAYLYYGGPGSDAIADLTFTGEAAEDSFGFRLGPAGDVNGDGFADLIVGASGSDAGGSPGADIGRVYVYYGGPGADTVADLVFDGEADGDNFGIAVGTVGDVNNDGFDDLIVGAYRNDAAGPSAGRAYVYFGGPQADATPDLILTGLNSGDRFGTSVGPAADVNGDGFDDFIIGADQASGTGAGRAYVFYGGPGIDTVADLVLTGEAGEDFFGFSVGTAGDVNGDGFADVVVGAMNNDTGGVDAGRVYVYFGGTLADTRPDIIVSGEVAGDKFGSSARSAGDLNGDGFSDLIVGASFSSANGSGSGRAYIYDHNRYQVISPNSGETWNVGALRSIVWLGSEAADVWLSVDGGSSYSLLYANVGGLETNALAVVVPHQPTRFAQVRITPHRDGLRGRARSDSLFTIEASIELLNMTVVPGNGGGGVVLSWKTDPGLADLAGYKLERSEAGSETWIVLASRLRDTEYQDDSGRAGLRYRLTGINGLGEELLLGEAALASRAPLSAWPLPLRGETLNLTFAIYGRLGASSGRATVTVHDAQGRRVRTIADGEYESGYQTTTWDGRDEAGHSVPSGVYFLRAASAGERHQMRLVVVR